MASSSSDSKFHSSANSSQAPTRDRHFRQMSASQSDPYQIQPRQPQPARQQQQHPHHLPYPAGTSSQRPNRIPSSVEAARVWHSPPPFPGLEPTRPRSATSSKAPPQNSYRPHSSGFASNLPNSLHFQYGSSPRPTPSSSGNHPRPSLSNHHPNSFPSGPSPSLGPQTLAPPLPGQSSGRRATLHTLPLQASLPRQLDPFPPVVASPVQPTKPNVVQAGRPSEVSPQTDAPPPNTPSSSPPGDAIISQTVETALQPLKATLENMWNSTRGNVQSAMTNMHQDFMRNLGIERQKNAQLIANQQELQERLHDAKGKAQAMEDQLAIVNKEKEAFARGIADLTALNADLTNRHASLAQERADWTTEKAGLVKTINELSTEHPMMKEGLSKAVRFVSGYKAELGKLNAEKQKLETDFRGLLATLQQNEGHREGQQPDVSDNHMTAILSTVSQQVTKQVEGKISQLLAEMQAQTALRIQAEREHEDTLKQPQLLKELAGSSTSSPLPPPRSIPPMTHSRRPSTSQLPSGTTPMQRRRSGSSFSSTSTQVQLELTTLSSDLTTPSPRIQPRHLTQNLMDSPASSRGTPSRRQISPALAQSRSSEAGQRPMSPPPPRKRSRAEFEEDRVVSSPPPRAVRLKAEVVEPDLEIIPPESRSEPEPESDVRVKLEPQDVEMDMDMDRADCEEGEVVEQDELPPAPATNTITTRRVLRNRPPVALPWKPKQKPSQRQSQPQLLPSAMPKSSSAPRAQVSEQVQAVPPRVARALASASASFQALPRRPESFQGRATPNALTAGTSLRAEPAAHPQPQRQPVNPRESKSLGIHHMDLLYLTANGSMTCRMCMTKTSGTTQSELEKTAKRFPQDTAKWADLIGHCRTEHPKACEDLEKMGPSQIAEMKQRMAGGIATSIRHG